MGFYACIQLITTPLLTESLPLTILGYTLLAIGTAPIVLELMMLLWVATPTFRRLKSTTKWKRFWSYQALFAAYCLIPIPENEELIWLLILGAVVAGFISIWLALGVFREGCDNSQSDRS